MASFDKERSCYVVRVVYDGPGMAGKTTNLRQVCKFVPTKKRSELYTPAELKGRTMFFDWLEVDAPPRAGQSIKFQLITVPGQAQRNYRRRPLVEMADVVVFVCDSGPAQIPDTMRTFSRLRASMKKRIRPLPLLVQANKQDVRDAFSAEKLRRKLRLDASVPFFPARAVDCVGVKETLIAAMRVGMETLVKDEIVPLASAFQNADALFDYALTFEDNPHDDEPVDAEELHIGAEETEIDSAAVAAHLAASSLDALEQRARRAARRAEEAADQPAPAAPSRRNKNKQRGHGAS
jgi:signal recognition particle receptor subunit beta